MSKIVLQKRVLDVMAREVAIQAAQVAQIARALESLHKALLQVGASATGARMRGGLPLRPVPSEDQADVDLD